VFGTARIRRCRTELSVVSIPLLKHVREPVRTLEAFWVVFDADLCSIEAWHRHFFLKWANLVNEFGEVGMPVCQVIRSQTHQYRC
jgi:hypothetical protein